MRWIWIDRIVEIEKGQRAVGVKNISSAEELFHEHFPATEHHSLIPIFPHPIIIEGMAQTAGVLVGYTGGFKEKVVLAKIGKAVFHCMGGPGFTMRFTTTLERFDVSGAATRGKVERIDPNTGESCLMAEINLMFSHIDRNRSNLKFPEHNFVFAGHLMDMMLASGLKLTEEEKAALPQMV